MLTSPVGTNRYAYAGNDPINRLDPTGHNFDDSGNGNARGNTTGSSTGNASVGGAGSVGGGSGGSFGGDQAGGDLQMQAPAAVVTAEEIIAIGRLGTVTVNPLIAALALVGWMLAPTPTASDDMIYDDPLGPYTFNEKAEEKPRLNPDGTKIPKDAWDKNGAKAPGKPGPETGFVDPPEGETWGTPVDQEKAGWVDEEGRQWVPTGQAGGGGPRHGGPHWDVQLPGGRTYQNVWQDTHIDDAPIKYGKR